MAIPYAPLYQTTTGAIILNFFKFHKEGEQPKKKGIWLNDIPFNHQYTILRVRVLLASSSKTRTERTK